jgi:hypothetical protein
MDAFKRKLNQRLREYELMQLDSRDIALPEQGPPRGHLANVLRAMAFLM